MLLLINFQRLKQIYFSVTNDLTGDQRVHRIISSLLKPGIHIHLIGRRFRNSLNISEGTYKTYRFNMVFNKGFLFYAFYNIRLFIYLLTRKKIDILVANDLDTLAPNYLVSCIRKTHLVYDSHEYFTESPELLNREFVKNFWLWLEKKMVPDLEYAYTVSHSIATEYQEKYGTEFKVIRNFPNKIKKIQFISLPFIPGGKKVLIYQGSLNIGRGLELIIEAFKDIQDVLFLIVGDGPNRKKLEQCVINTNLSDKVYFIGKVPVDKLDSITVQADGGISFEEDMCLNYRYSLPNKLFDYIHAQVPVLVSALPEMARIVQSYKIGIIAYERDIEHIREYIKELLFNIKKREVWKKNLVKAAQELSWEKEEAKVQEIFSALI